MTSTNCPTAAMPETAVPSSKRGRLSPTAAFYLQASITVSFLAGSSAPTPLYSLYQAEWGFSATMVTMIFAIYAIAVLASLLVAGRLSDHVGRRPVLFAAIAAQIFAMILFGTATGVEGLIVARIVQGLSAGAAVAAVGAGLLDLRKEHGAIANAVTPPIGTGLGAILAGLMVQFLPAPTQLVYGVLAMVYYAQGIGVFLMSETHLPRPGAWASLKPTLTLPRSVRGPMLLAVPALVAVWALAGFYASLGPALVRGLVGIDSSLLGGATLFVMAASAAIATAVLRNAMARTLTLVGAYALLAGMVVGITALSIHSPAAFFMGTAMAGIGFGAGFQGAIRAIATHAAPHERAGALSIAFVISYLAMGVPAVVAGYLVTRQGDILATAREFGVAVIVLSVVTLVAEMRRVRT
ncbi:MAG: MFS transporter [Usitatibacter sp.]